MDPNLDITVRSEDLGVDRNDRTELIQELRDRTGFGLHHCQKALRWAGGDIVLAEGWLRFLGTSVQSVEASARAWADRKRAEGKS